MRDRNSFLRPLLKRFRRAAGGVSAIEFAIWAPVMTFLVFGGIDVTRYTIATGRISDVASTIGQMLSVDSSGTVNYIDVQFYHDSAMAIYPQVLMDAKQRGVSWTNDIAITMTSVTFTATPLGCTTSCVYVPKVVWTSGTNKRSCIVPLLASSSDTAASSALTLPPDAFGPTSLLVVDVVYTFRPLFASRLLSSIPISRSYYVSPRYVPTVGYQVIAGDTGIATVCP